MSIEYTIGLYSTFYKNADLPSIKKLLEDKKITDKGIYEVLDNKEYIKPYFDIDFKRIEDEEKFDSYIKNLDNFLKETTQTIGKYFKFNKEDLAISTANTDKKISYHIIINNYKIKFKDLRDYIKDDSIKKDFKNNYIDTGVYNEKQKIRMIHTSKIKKNDISPPLIPITYKEEISKHLIQIIDENAQLIIVDENKKKSDIKMIKSYDEISRLGKIIDIKYLDSYDTWCKIIWSLKSFGENYKSIAENISRRSKKFDKSGFESCWKSFNGVRNEFSIGTYYHYCKISNIEKYIKIRSEYMEDIKYPSDLNIAMLFIKIFGFDFVYCKKILYYFNGIYWEVDDTKHYLRTYLYKRMNIYFLEKIKTIKQCDQTEDNKSTIYLNAIKYLNYKKNVENISSVVLDFIQDDKINFDSNPHLFSFNNKIYDLKYMTWITPRREDYITMTTGYDYVEPQQEDIKFVEKIIEEIFPIIEERELYMTILSTGLVGITLEKFILANGDGGNGKGVINELTEIMMGNYAYNCTNGILLQNLKGGGSNVEVANMNNKRIIFYREPDTMRGKGLFLSTIKELTGGSKINARLNYSNNTVTNLRATHILECNEKPKILGNMDNAAARRILDIPFRSTFVPDVSKYTGDYIYQGNSSYKHDNFKNKYKLPLFIILLKYWKIYLEKNENIDHFVCKSVKERTGKYIKNNDELINWFKSIYKKIDDDTEILKISDIYDKFKVSNIWENFSKREKREFTKNHFIDKISSNIYLKKYFKNEERRKYILEKYNVDKRIRNVLVGFVHKNNDDITYDDNTMVNENGVIEVY